MAKKPDLDRTVVAQNRKARHNYFIEETFEAGLSLTGTEVKSLRGGRSTIAESYVTDDRAARPGWSMPTSPNTPRATASITSRAGRASCCCTAAQINKLIGAIQREGRTVVPLQVYFNDKGRAKIEIALATGKKAHDKRASIKERDWQRQRSRLLARR